MVARKVSGFILTMLMGISFWSWIIVAFVEPTALIGCAVGYLFLLLCLPGYKKTKQSKNVACCLLAFSTGLAAFVNIFRVTGATMCGIIAPILTGLGPVVAYAFWKFFD